MNDWSIPDPNRTTIRRRKNVRSLRRRDGLIQYASNNTSQNGEDGIISRIFDHYLSPRGNDHEVDDRDGNELQNVKLNNQKMRYCVDVGAWDGVHLSNTHSLLVGGGDKSAAPHSASPTTFSNNNDADSTKGNDEIVKKLFEEDISNGSKWKGVLIEADEPRFAELKKLHDPLGNICIHAEVSCDPTSPHCLISLLRHHAPQLPHDFDFLSIDVDGMDYWVLANVLGCGSSTQSNNSDGIDLVSQNTSAYRPKVICIEFNPSMPTDLVYIQPRDDGIRHGSSLSALCELCNAMGYELVETTLFNAFFVRRDLYERYFKTHIPDTSIEALHEITMGTNLYQLYDGTIKLWGCKRMLWHRIPMNEEKMQIIPSQQRLFPFAPSSDTSACQTTSFNNTEQSENEPTICQNQVFDTKKNDQIRASAIDMSSYCQTSPTTDVTSATIQRQHECASQLNRMLQTDGFALIRGTGILGKTCDNALRAAKSFLHEADEPVRRSCLTKDRARRGYSPMCTENFASLIGEHGPNDLVKKFRVGPSPVAPCPSDHWKVKNEKGPMMSSPLHQPNAWPDENVWGAEQSSLFRISIENYFEETCRVADCILHAICDAIVDKNPELSTSMKVLSTSNKSEANDMGHQDQNHHTSILTLLGYQMGSRHKKGSKGYRRPLVAPHTDVGVITILLFDSGKCASLQRAASSSLTAPVNSKKENWIDVHLPQGPLADGDPIFVVNVGDCLSDLSGGSLRSTLHRVIPHPCVGPAKEMVRTCLALFVGLEPHAHLLLPSSDGGNVMSYEEWRRRRIARASDVLKKQSS